MTLRHLILKYEVSPWSLMHLIQIVKDKRTMMVSLASLKPNQNGLEVGFEPVISHMSAVCATKSPSSTHCP